MKQIDAIIGLDVGTSNIKCVIYTLCGAVLAQAKRNIAVLHPSDGYCELNMEGVWDAAAETILSALNQSNNLNILSISITGQGDGLWLLDKDLMPVRNAILWNDNRAHPIIERWNKNGISEQIFRINGTMHWPGSAGALLSWLRENESYNYKRIRWVICCKDWIRYKLTGVICTDYTDGSIPFMNIKTGEYSGELFSLMKLTALQECLPPVFPSHSKIGELSVEAGKIIKVKPGVPVVNGSVDVLAAAVGSGVISNLSSLSIIGTTSVSAIVFDSPNTEPKNIGSTTYHAIPGMWLRAMGSLAGTPNLDWFINNLFVKMGVGSKNYYKKLEKIAVESKIGAGGIIYHPYLYGERAPFLEPFAKASFFGIQPTTRFADLARSVYEGIAFSIRDAYTYMGSMPTNTVLCGGGSASSFWCQMLADVLGVKVFVQSRENAALGAAIMATVGLGVFPGYEEAVQKMVRFDKTYHPESEAVDTYTTLYNFYHNHALVIKSEWVELHNSLKTRKYEGPNKVPTK